MIRRFFTVAFFLASVCLPGYEKALAVTSPSSAITFPTGGLTLYGQAAAITGTARDFSGSGLKKVEVSINGSAWLTASGTASWSFAWTLPADGAYTISSRATDNSNNVETPGAGIAVVIDNLGTPELPHYNWDAALQGQGCSICHTTASKFMPSGYDITVGFCFTCHNASGIAYGSQAGDNQHPVMVNVSTSWTKKPSYGNVTAVANDNRPFANLMYGRLIVCATCHNAMNKYEDLGRSWEFTTTPDYKTYYLQKGGWSFMGYMEPKVYRSTGLWNGPTYSSDRKGYLVDQSEYTYDETAGTVTFASAQAPTSYIYVTLDYPYLRASSMNNVLCLDCHKELTHEGANCLVCHQAHNTANIGNIRQAIRTTDLSVRAVKFINMTGHNSFADGGTVYDGVCEVCHRTTLYYRRDGTGSLTHADGKNYSGKDCTRCHSHLYGFASSKPAAPPISIGYLSPNPAGALSGSTVTWTAGATGGTGNLQYQFLRNGPETAGAFTVAQNWGTSSRWPWTTTNAMAGGNIVRVSVRNSDGSGTVASRDYVAYPLTLYLHQGVLTWGPSASTVLAGYKVYYGTSSGVYTQSAAAGKVTAYAVSNLSSGVKYYFALTSYDSFGNESPYSNEVSLTMP